MERRGDNVIPFRPRSASAGVEDPVETSSASLLVYGRGLDPQVITHLLGVEPTSSVPPAEAAGPQPGIWVLTVGGSSPDGPDEHIARLFDLLPADAATWDELRERHHVVLSVAFHSEGASEVFQLSPRTLGHIAARGLSLEFDLWAYEE